jgi:hypothetical protein
LQYRRAELGKRAEGRGRSQALEDGGPAWSLGREHLTLPPPLSSLALPTPTFLFGASYRGRGLAQNMRRPSPRRPPS